MPSNINLNISPYFDDFNEDNDYYKVLFKPGVSVQSRELTTLQSILQNQIEKFGKHFFVEGAMIIPGQVGYDANYKCVEIDSTHLGIPVSIYLSYLSGAELRGRDSGVLAVVDFILSETESDRGNNTLYVKYISAGTNGQTTFADGEDLLVQSDINYGVSTISANSSIATTIISNSNSIGSACKITDGVYFIRGFFVSVNSETILLDQYSNTPSYRVGLKIEEDIAIASNGNPDLYDNAQGFKNYTAPGADRLRIKTSLIKKSLTDVNDDDFIELIRVENGEVKKYVKDTQYNLLRDELARRTYDESGNYSVTPYSISIRDSLDNFVGNNGLFRTTDKTPQGSTPSDNLAILNISPGKSYVKGYELENISTVSLDLNKARDTSQQTTTVPFNLGKQLILNNVENSVPLGYNSNITLNLLGTRTTLTEIATAQVVGTAKLYNLVPISYGSTQSQHRYEVTLYDVQTNADLTLNNAITLNTPAFIEGTKSNASAYLFTNAQNTNILRLTQVSGNFLIGESLRVNGSETIVNPANNTTQRISVRNFVNYSIDSAKQISHIPATGVSTFRADFELSKRIDVADQSTTFTYRPGTVTAGIANTGTITSGTEDFKVGLKFGDIVSYTKPGESVETFNRVIRVGRQLGGIDVEPIPSVVGICSGTVGISTFNFTGLKKRTLQVNNPESAFLYAKLNNSPVAGIVTTQSVEFTRSYEIVIPENRTFTQAADQGLNFSSYATKKYSLTYRTTGTIENDLDGAIGGVRKVTVDPNQVLLSNLSESGNAILTVTYTKPNPSQKRKIYNRCNSLIINRSSSANPGFGLTTSQIYGTRIEDKEISLNVCDVESILGIFQSSGESDPALSNLLFTDISSNVSGLVKGELLVGSQSGAVASFVESNAPNSITFVYRNNFTFTPGEKITAQESNINGTVGTVSLGDQNITNNFIFENGQNREYLDFAKIIRKINSQSPSRKLRIIFNNYIIDPGDSGDFVTVNSYDADRYNNNIPSIDGIRLTDVIDVRPRVSPYSLNSTRSPFEPISRNYSSQTTNSSTEIFVDQDFVIRYNYYLPRTDSIVLGREVDSTNKGDAVFTIVRGVPALNPIEPISLPEGTMKIASLNIPAYTFNADDIKINYIDNKRYTMRDISNLETRLSNVEYTTSLNLLELQTKSLTQTDSRTGLNKFKSGFFVDNFADFSSSDVKNPQFRSAIDPTSNQLRVSSNTEYLDLVPGVLGALNEPRTFDVRYSNDWSVSGATAPRRTGDTLSMNYTERVYLRNEQSSGTQRVNPFNSTNNIGTLELSPNEDIWFQGSRTEDQDTNAPYKPEIVNSWNINIVGEDSDRSLRPRNIEVVARDLVGFQPYYAFLDNVSVNNLMVPKLIPIRMQANSPNPFRVGETVVAYSRVEKNAIRFRVANINHKVGPYNNPTEVYTQNPYNQNTNIPNTYTLTSTILNIDLASLCEKNIPFYWGNFTIGTDTFLYGTSSGAIASLAEGFNDDRRIVANQFGEYFGSLFIPDFNINPNRKFSFSTKTLILSPDRIGPFRPGRLFGNSARTNFYAVNINSPYNNNKTVPTNLTNDCSIAQLFDVRDPNGVFLTKCDVFFRERPDPNRPGRPVKLQIREVENGIPTDKVVENSTVFRNNTNININRTATTFTFNSLVYLEPGKTYAIQLSSESNLYQVAVSQTNQQNAGSAILRSMAGFNVAAQGGPGFGNEDYTVARNGGFSDSDIRFFLRVQHTGNIGAAIQTRLNDTTWGIVPVPFTRNMRTAGFNVTAQGGPGFGVPDYDAAIRQGFSEDDIVHFLLNEFTGNIGTEMRQRVLSYANSNNFFGTETTAGRINNVIPRIGSLLISDPQGIGWDEDITRKLTFTLHRAQFDTQTTAAVRFFNPDFDAGNNGRTILSPNPITTYSRKIRVGLNSSFSLVGTGISVGSIIRQQNNAGFRGVLQSLVGPIGLGSNLTITSAGIGYTARPKVYSNVPLRTLTGTGSNARIDLQIGSGGVAIAATVSNVGTGYAIGDTLTIDNEFTDNLGRDLILTIPNAVGIISTFDTLIIDNVQQDVQIGVGNFIHVNSDGVAQTLLDTNPTVAPIVLQDGQHFKVEHHNHGMYAENSVYVLGRLMPDVPPARLTAEVDFASTPPFNINVDNVGIFTTFENIAVGVANTGYLKIGEEIFGYTGTTPATGNVPGTISIVSRTVDLALRTQPARNTLVYKYELNGVSLRRINNTHDSNNTDSNKYPTTLDSYHIRINTTDPTRGTVRDNTTRDGVFYPNLYFNSTKTAGSINFEKVGQLVVESAKADRYISFNRATVATKTFTPSGTTLSAKLRTISNSSVDGNEVPYVDQGFVDIDTTYDFNSPRVVLNRASEDRYFQAERVRKSLTLSYDLSTTDERVSPIINLNRVGVFLTLDRIDRPVTNFIDDPRVNSRTDDPHSAIYITKEILLKNASDTLTVIFDAALSPSSDIRVMYRLLRPDLPDKNEIWQFFPGYNNKDSRGFTIDPDLSDGKSDSNIALDPDPNVFLEYTYSETNLPLFTGFQIKIIMSSPEINSNLKIKNLRGIATI